MAAAQEILDLIIGWEPREAGSFEVFRHSLERRTSKPLHILPLMQKSVRYNGLYWRKQEERDGILFDTISDAPMATEFSITRFLAPILQQRGWVLFAEPDMVCLEDIAFLFDLRDDSKAVMCVQHRHKPQRATKRDNQLQTHYARKNWSSLMLINADHPGNKRLTVEMVNTLPGRDLHRFCWLEDSEIGSLPIEWNYLVGEDMPARVKPKILHYTNGTPELVNDCPMAEPWLKEKATMRRPLPSEWRNWA